MFFLKFSQNIDVGDFSLGLDFILLMFYFQTFTKFILKFHKVSTAFPKCNVKFPKNFPSLEFFLKFCNFSSIFWKAYLPSILKISSNFTTK